MVPAMRRILKQRQVKTSAPTTRGAAPRLPHERDESPDSQALGAPREDMQQASDDLKKGLVDTDLRGATPGTGQANRPRDDPPGTLAAADRRTRAAATKKLPDGK